MHGYNVTLGCELIGDVWMGQQPLSVQCHGDR